MIDQMFGRVVSDGQNQLLGDIFVGQGHAILIEIIAILHFLAAVCRNSNFPAFTGIVC